VAVRLDELPAAAGKTWDIRIATSESWDAASGTGNIGFGIADAELASLNDSGMGL
jgi:hypothetical protein